MRCPDCNKFTSYDDGAEPEVQSGPDVNEDAVVTASVRIVLPCADCGTELKEATFDLEEPPDDADFAAAHRGEGHSLSVEETGCSMTSRSEGRGRGTRTFYGADLDVTVTCECGAKVEFTLSDEERASSMDELV